MKKPTIFLAFIMLFNIITVGCGPELIIGPVINFFLVWKNGEAHKCYRHDTDTIYRTVKRSLKEMNIPIIEDEGKDDDGYYLIAGENNKFKIKVREVEKDISRLSVRINFMGDKPYAELFYDKVDEELSTIDFGPNGKPVKK